MEADDLQQPAAAQDAASEHLIADRLDALEAERVMQRALELESESLDQPHVITSVQLEKIAKEIGVDASFVRQALGELRMEPEQRSRFAELLIPDALVETAAINGLSREDTEASITKWMTQHEGFVRGGLISNGVEWDVDRRWRTRVLARSLSGGNRISRLTGGDVTHRVHSVSEQEHVVSLAAEGRWPLTFATLVLAVGTALSTIMLFNVLASAGLTTGIGAFIAMMAGTVAVAIGGARWWARGIRSALRRSLVGLVSAARPKRTSRFSLRRSRRKRKDQS